MRVRVTGGRIRAVLRCMTRDWVRGGSGVGLALAVSVAGALAVAVEAKAQQAPAAAVPAAPAGAGGGLFALPDGVRLTVGAAGLMIPKYEGAKASQFIGVPIISFAPLATAGSPASSGGGSGPVEIRAFDDVAISLLRVPGLQIGAMTGYRLGRAESASPRLKGLGDVDGGIVAGAFVRFNFDPGFLRVALLERVSGSDTGGILRVTGGSQYALTPAILLKGAVTADFADQDYMQSYFGVTSAQAARSKLAQYTPGEGLKSVGAMIATEYALTTDWTLIAQADYRRLVGSASRSPIVESADQFELKLGATYAFDWRFK